MNERVTSFVGLRAVLVAVIGLWFPTHIKAGSYGPQTFDYPDGTTDLLDGSSLVSSRGQIQVRNGALQPIPIGQKEVVGVFTLPELDSDSVEIGGFDASFDLDWRTMQPTPDHFVIHFGDIPRDAPELVRRFELDEGLAIQLEFLGQEASRLEIFIQGQTLGKFPFPVARSPTESWLLQWDDQGLDLSIDDVSVFSDLALPGFMPKPGYRFAFSAANQFSPAIDNLTIKTVPLTLPKTDGIVISEFVVINKDGLKDEDGDRSGWIELYNGTDHSIDLSQWKLESTTPSETHWNFPKISLPNDRHLLVWASGKNKTGPEGELHANFVLGENGGQLTLAPLEGSSQAPFTIRYGKQYKDVSYAMRPDKNGSDYAYHAHPTPNRLNRGLHAPRGPAGAVTFSAESGLITSPMNLTLSLGEGKKTPLGKIRYTTDRTEPLAQSESYRGPITIDKSITIRARATPDNHLPGPVTTRSFTMMDPDVSQFSSNLPIIVADSGGADIDSDLSPEAPRPHRPVYAAVFDLQKETKRASLTNKPAFQGMSGMHVRGNSSARLFPKKQYAWEIRDETGEDLDVSLLDMPREADWILHAPYSDKTLMRNMLAYETARMLHGRQGAVRAKYVELFFNQDGEILTMDDYRGIYILMEKNKRGQARIDISKLSEKDDDPDIITGGYIFKKDKALFDDVTLITQKEQHKLGIVYPKAPTANQQTYLQRYLNEFESVLHGNDFADPVHGYANYIDVDSFIDLHWLVEVFREIDGFRISAYFTKDRYGKIYALPVWDYNLSLGNVDFGSGPDFRGWHHRSIDPSAYPWYARLFEDPVFKRRWEQRYFELRETLFHTNTLMHRIDGYANHLQEAIPRNFRRWPILGKYVWPNPGGFEDRQTYESEIDWMKTWWRNRLDWIDSQFMSPPRFSHPEGGIPLAERIDILKSGNIEGRIYYTLDGTDPGIDQIKAIPIITASQAQAEILIPTVQNSGSRLKVSEWTTLSAPPNQAAWEQGGAGVGYESGDNNFAGLIGHAVPQMANQSTSCFIRIPFTLTQIRDLENEELLLRMKYDDGFVAYLNGNEIARSNAPAKVNWQSAASRSRGDSAAINWESFDIIGATELLREGRNMLAIHGLNRSPDSSDALWHSEIVRIDRSGSRPAPTAKEYTKPISLTKRTTVNAAVFANRRWSPTMQATYEPGIARATPDNLVIFEVHSSPKLPENPILADADAYEFVRLKNVGNHPLSLRGVRFLEGIRCRLDPDKQLYPGETGVVVRSRAAFESVYGNEEKIVGEFDGSLRDKGESLTLIDADGGAINGID